MEEEEEVQLPVAMLPAAIPSAPHCGHGWRGVENFQCEAWS